MKKKILEMFLLIISVVAYIYLLFISKIELGTGRKELENIFVLIVPCLIFFNNSLKTNNEIDKGRYLYYYLVMYIFLLIGFTFSNDRIKFGDINLIRDYNLIPFKSMHTMLTSSIGIKEALYNIIGNFLMLSPLAILLPLIFKRYKILKNYLFIILFISLFIEFMQYITNIGSFDIDDVILNFSGALITYLVLKISSISKIVQIIFYKLKMKDNIVKIVGIFLIIILILIICMYGMKIYSDYKENKIDLSHLTCISEEETFIITIGEYSYYSNCKYSGYILKGNVELKIDEYIKTKPSNEMLDKLSIKKEAWLVDIKLQYTNDSPKLVNKYQNTYTYLYGIKGITILKKVDNEVKEIVIEDNLTKNEFNFFSLVSIATVNMKEESVFYTGNYYNIIGCNNNNETYNYIVPNSYDYSLDFCSNIKNY